jgi:predicted GIY-YIG superfamily endonuclease
MRRRRWDSVIGGIQMDMPRRATYRGKVYSTAVEPIETELYRHFDKDERLLYVGIATNSITRFWQHKKNSPWFDQVFRVATVIYPSREQAVAAERRAIAVENPVHNKIERNIFRPRRQRPMSDPPVP